MDDKLRELLSAAFRTVPARDANAEIAKARAEAVEEGAAPSRRLRDDEGAPLSRSYEMVLDPAATFASFAAEILPRLVYHLESIGARPPGFKGVLVAIFDGEDLHFARAGDLVGRAAALSSVPVEELFRRHGTGESHTAQRGPPLPLPPPRE
ncbi:MAG: STAUR_1299 family protein [Myxococcales bacterium]